MSLASAERAAICDEFERVGPDRPTLCEGWNTRDLLAHLLVRERKPWASGGIMVPALAPMTEHAMQGYADTPWDEMIDQLRAGAPPWSPFAIRKFDELGNGGELFVHHEDVRRGEPGWVERDPDPVRDAELWAMLLRMGRMLYRGSKVGVVLRRPSGDQHVVRTGPGLITVVGPPGEIVMHAFGRTAAHVEVEGSAADLAELAKGTRGV